MTGTNNKPRRSGARLMRRFGLGKERYRFKSNRAPRLSRCVMLSQKSATLRDHELGAGIERDPQAEGLLPGRAFRSFERLGNLLCRGLRLGKALQFANVVSGPFAPLRSLLGHDASMETGGNIVTTKNPTARPGLCSQNDNADKASLQDCQMVLLVFRHEGRLRSSYRTSV
jgi:hypothetical protein